MIIRLRRLGRVCACVFAFAASIAVATMRGAAEPQTPGASSRNNLVVEPRSAEVVSNLRRIVIEVRAKEFKEPYKTEVRSADAGGIKGAFYVPPGVAREFRVSGYDAEGKLTYEGSTIADVAREGATSITVALNPRTDRGEPVVLNIASYSIQIDSKPDPKGGYALQARVFDPSGSPANLTPDDYNWGTHGPGWYGDRPFRDKPGRDVHFPPPPPPETTLATLCPLLNVVTVCINATVCRNINVCADPVVQVSAGGSHTCALTQNGIVRCWGDNSDGQLGMPTTAGCGVTSQEVTCQPTPTPVACPAGSSCRFTEISAGLAHTCAIDSAKTVWCWGKNSRHQLGANSAPGDKSVHVKSVANAVHIAAGDEFTCALTAPPNGQKFVVCWGANDKGQTGAPLVARCSVNNINNAIQCGDPQDVAVPRQVMAFPQNKMIVAGSRHACAVTTDGFMRCWGDNSQLQVANMQAITVATFTADAASTTQPGPLQNCGTCTITPVTVFGALVSGANGSPLDVAGAGGNTTCASLTGSSSACWGTNPVSYPFTTSVTSMDAGKMHACAVTSMGTQCWGNGDVGQLGDGRSSFFGGINAPTPVNVITTATFKQLSAGSSHTCALTTDGHVQCWGRNAEGQLGTGSFATVIATAVPSLM